ncbi:MAG: NB-ARC domain-containing protein [Jaaginema sp. PMC 1079.18]|nr:NB-ARC domain-containing protein [Jaaginema sp. PMC 1080.18]MEC4849897.1 NB-ARC domain-containing protein [Jaaginema sp. PMC 1079.18]MEC4865990.1 NB-ARC domain-containing protein [Jaaginema sp. PMC 1078.18]
MADTLKASKQGLAQVDRARQRQGWTKTRTPAWWDAAYTTQATLKRFWRGIAIQRENFIAICQAVGIEDWQQIAEFAEAEVDDLASPQNVISWQNWGEAPEVPYFYGRTWELQQLESWIAEDRCKLVMLLGMGGIGKTALSVTIAEQLQDRFEGLIWRSLLSAPPLPALLDSLIQFLSRGQQTLTTDNIQQAITQTVTLMQAHRCLIVLDEVEAICGSSGENGGRIVQYLPGYEDYGEFFRRMGSDRHQSCVLMTSREKPGEVVAYEGQMLPVRSLQLRGLEVRDAMELLQAQGFSGSENELQMLIHFYSGNPLALKSITTMIREVFNGNIGAFLHQNTIVLGDRLRTLLAQQINRLSDLEMEILYWFAIAQEPLSLNQLRAALLFPPSQSRLFEYLAALERRSLLDKIINSQATLFTLQPLVMKYAIEKFVEQSCQEIQTVLNTQEISNFRVFKNHRLNPQTPATGRYPPARILQRLKNNLQMDLRCDETQIARQLLLILPLLQHQSPLTVGYTAANLRELLVILGWNFDRREWQNIPLIP